jgi:flagellar basal body P-ring formation protein FlgA
MTMIGLGNPAAAQDFNVPEGTVRIELRANFVARDAGVRLGDVANLYTRDLPTIQRLSALPLGRAPLAGTEAVLRRDVVARWVRSRLGIDADRIAWGAVEETHVRTLDQHLAASRIEQAAANALRNWLGQRASRYEIDTLPLGQDVKLPAGEVELKAHPLEANLAPQSRMVVWMDVLVEGRFVRTVPVSFAVAAYRDAWVAPAPIAKGVPLEPGMMHRREVPITGRPLADPYTRGAPSTGGASGRRTTRAVKDGEPLTARNTAPVPAIARGDWVALHLKSGLVELERRAQALQDGELGQIVKVRAVNDATPVEVLVVAPGRVEVRR